MKFNVVGQIGEALMLVRKHKRMYWLLVLLAFLMISSITAVVTYTSVQIVFNVRDLNQVVTATTPLLGQDLTDPSSMVPLLKQYKAVIGHYEAIKTNAILLIGGVFVLWVLLGGTSWWLGEKKFLPYIGKFALVSLVWYGILLLTGYLLFKLLLLRAQGFVLTSLDTTVTIFLVIAAIVVYFGVISLSLLAKYPFWKLLKKTFVVGVTRFFYLLSIYLVWLVGMAIIVFIGMGLYRVADKLLLVAVVILFFYVPLMRIFVRRSILLVDGNYSKL